MNAQDIVVFLEGAWDRAIDGFVGLSGAEALAEEHRAKSKTIDEAIDNLIEWQTAQSAGLGFVANIGGLITLPISIPADVAGTAMIQLRMVAAIAHLRGHNIRDEKVRTFGILCLIGNAAIEVLKELGVQLGIKLTGRLIAQISGATLTKINQAVGFRLVTKAGQTGLVNLTKWIPVIGGVIGATFDGVTTYGVGQTAKKIFPSFGSQEEESFIDVEPEAIS